MIARWIARALLAGEDHLVLSKAELAQWHVQGCRISNDSPHGLWGSYAMRHLFHMRQSAEAKLLALPVDDWPSGPYPGWDGRKGPRGTMPPIEARPLGEDRWQVPLFPADPGHALDAWRFDLLLGHDEWQAIGPWAKELLGHCLLTSYCKTTDRFREHLVPWDDSRLQLAAMAGVSVDALRRAFDSTSVRLKATEGDRTPLTLGMVLTLPGA